MCTSYTVPALTVVTVLFALGVVQVDVVDGIPLEVALVFFYGSVTVDNPDLFKRQARERPILRWLGPLDGAGAFTEALEARGSSIPFGFVHLLDSGDILGASCKGPYLHPQLLTLRPILPLRRRQVERLAEMLAARAQAAPGAAASGCVVNTMGWVDGLGYELLLHTVASLQVPSSPCRTPCLPLLCSIFL